MRGNREADLVAERNRFGRGFANILHARKTLLSIRILVLCYLIPYLWNLWTEAAPDRIAQAQYLFGLQTIEIEAGKLWKLFSYALIHGDWIHLAINSGMILLLGSKIEQYVETKSFWTLIIGSVIAGGISFYLFRPSPDFPNQIGMLGPATLVGSSAVCFSCLMFIATVSPDSRFMPFLLSGRLIGVAILITNLFFSLADPKIGIAGFSDLGLLFETSLSADLFQISHACHLGGSVFGWLCGLYLLRPRISLERLQRERRRREQL